MQAIFDFLPDVRANLQFACVIVLWLVSLRGGASPERVITSTLMFLWIVETIYHALIGENAPLDDIFHASLDVVILVPMLVVALYSNRTYTLWVSAFQVVAVNAHLANHLLNAKYLAFAINFSAPSWFQVGFTAFGLIAHMRHENRHGNYPSWRTHLPPWAARHLKEPPGA